MAVEGVRLGPFLGGLNTASDPASIGDTDAAIMDNLELDLDGSLISRPPIVDLGTPISEGSNLHLVGFFVNNDDTVYLIAHNTAKTFYYVNGAWAEICPFPAADVTQYKNKLWIIAPYGSASSGGSWDPTGGFATVTDMPKGSSIVAHKERLWITLGPSSPDTSSRLYYSEVGAPNSWPGGGDFLNISDGDGQDAVAVALYYNELIVFKTRSAYRFAYSSSPDQGIVTRVTDSVGAASPRSIASYDNALYVIFSDKVYEVSNYNFTQINQKVPLTASSYSSAGRVDPVSISVWHDRLLVNYFGTTYVYSLKTQTWSTWSSSMEGFTLGRVLPIPLTTPDQKPDAFVANAMLGDGKIYSISDTLAFDRTENIKCIFLTKNYDYQSPHAFKRLLHWGLDTFLRGNVSAKVTPIVYGLSPTWGQLKQYTWAQIGEGTWGRLLDIDISVNDAIEVHGGTGDRKFIKFLKSLRFRQINFRLEFDIDGTPTTSPVKLFSLTTFVSVKEKVFKKVS